MGSRFLVRVYYTSNHKHDMVMRQFLWRYKDRTVAHSTADGIEYYDFDICNDDFNIDSMQQDCERVTHSSKWVKGIDPKNLLITVHTEQGKTVFTFGNLPQESIPVEFRFTPPRTVSEQHEANLIEQFNLLVRSRLEMTDLFDNNPNPVVLLCGSTKYHEDFDLVEKCLTLNGVITLSTGRVFGHRGDIDMSGPVKKSLDRLHFKKIELCDAVFIVNPEGRIGLSTCDELHYAKALGKRVMYMINPVECTED